MNKLRFENKNSHVNTQIKNPWQKNKLESSYVKINYIHEFIFRILFFFCIDVAKMLTRLYGIG